MVHVVEGGDYGFRFMYGRSGKHPFQSWHGQLPGTLPMMTGVGEAPCEIVSYESDGLPAEYRGQLLVTSWADHRVERYAVKPHGASFKAERLPFIQGGQDFRPVGLCVAPDGSLYFTDWVKRDYTLHGHGAIWHVSMKDQSRERKRPVEPREAIFSMHRPLREAAAKKLASDEAGRKFLYEVLDRAAPRADPRVRASALTVLIDAGIGTEKLIPYGNGTDLDLGEMAYRVLNARHNTDESHKALTIAMFATDYAHRDPPSPFGRHDTVQRLATNPKRLKLIDPSKLANPRQRIMLLLAWRATSATDAPAMVGKFLNDPDETIRFLAVKWIADEKLADYREDVVKAMRDPKLNVRMYMAYATALARLDGLEVNEKSLADYFAKRLADDATPAEQRVMLLKQVPATHGKLTVELLGKLLAQDDAALKLEAVRALAEHPNPKRSGPLLGVFRNPKLGVSLRAYALLGLADRAQEYADELIEVAKNQGSPLRADAVRALIGVKGVPIAHVPEKDRPAAKELDAWMKRLEGPADVETGARIFAHPKLGGCYKCHRVDGRGKDVGPDLSNIGQTDRRHLLESILQPSNNVAPHYQVWYLETSDGKVRNGMLLDTNLDQYTYLDANGGTFKINTRDVVEILAVPISIMPDGLVDRMTDQEMRDLLAYLQTRK
jgi:putative heme-binding domain-containing protein